MMDWSYPKEKQRQNTKKNSLPKGLRSVGRPKTKLWDQSCNVIKMEEDAGKRENWWQSY